MQVQVFVLRALSLTLISTYRLLHLRQQFHPSRFVAFALLLNVLQIFLFSMFIPTFYMILSGHLQSVIGTFGQLIFSEILCGQLGAIPLSVLVLCFSNLIVVVDGLLVSESVGNALVDSVLALALVFVHLTFVEGAHMLAILVAVGQVLLIFALLVVGVL